MIEWLLKICSIHPQISTTARVTCALNSNTPLNNNVRPKRHSTTCKSNMPQEVSWLSRRPVDSSLLLYLKKKMQVKTPSYVSLGFRGNYSLPIIKITIQTILEYRVDKIYKLPPKAVKLKYRFSKLNKNLPLLRTSNHAICCPFDLQARLANASWHVTWLHCVSFWE